MVNDFAEYCSRCQAVKTCKRMFGRFWEIKSTAGTGCQHPVQMEIEDEVVQPHPMRQEMPRRPVRPVRITQTDFWAKTKGTR